MDFTLSPDHDTFLARVRQFADDRVAPEAAAIDASAAFPRDVIADAAALGLMGLTIPQARGGAGRDYVTYSAAIEAIARASATVAVILTVNNSLVAEPLHEWGSDAQKDRWLDRLAS